MSYQPESNNTQSTASSSSSSSSPSNSSGSTSSGVWGYVSSWFVATPTASTTSNTASQTASSTSSSRLSSNDYTMVRHGDFPSIQEAPELELNSVGTVHQTDNKETKESKESKENKDNPINKTSKEKRDSISSAPQSKSATPSVSEEDLFVHISQANSQNNSRNNSPSLKGLAALPPEAYKGLLRVKEGQTTPEQISTPSSLGSLAESPAIPSGLKGESYSLFGYHLKKQAEEQKAKEAKEAKESKDSKDSKESNPKIAKEATTQTSLPGSPRETPAAVSSTAGTSVVASVAATQLQPQPPQTQQQAQPQIIYVDRVVERVVEVEKIVHVPVEKIVKVGRPAPRPR